MQESNSKVAIAKRTIALLDEYDTATKPMIEAVNRAKEGRGHLPTAGSAKDVGSKLPENERSRDPRLVGRAT